MPRQLSTASALRFQALLLPALVFAGCSGPGLQLEEWRRAQTAGLAPTDLSHGSLAVDLARIERLRGEGELDRARAAALALVQDHAEDAAVLTAASRAESDAVFLFPEDDKRSRNHAAASALDYALAAEKHGGLSASDRGQLAWALGTTTHLQPMFDRSSHAKRTLETARSALALDPREPTALATLALVNLRLETLPWIASAMAWTAPDSSLADAERHARAACESRSSRENLQILAKVLIAAGREPEAREVLDRALAASASFPRDRALESALRKLRASLD